MRSRLLLNVCLLLTAAGLAAIAYVYPGKPTNETPPSLLPVALEDIKRIRIERAGVGALALTREQGVWHMQAPYRLAVNQVRADAVARLSDAVSFAQLAVEGDLGSYGLDNPRLRVTLNEESLEFGDTDPLYKRRYVRVGGTLHLIADGGYHHLLASPAGFVHPKPLGPDTSMTAIELADARLVHTPQGWLAEPAQPAVDPLAIDTLVRAWRAAQATTVRARDPTLEAEQVVTIHKARGTTAFEVARTDHELILMRMDAEIQYHLPLETGRRLLNLGKRVDG